MQPVSWNHGWVPPDAEQGGEALIALENFATFRSGCADVDGIGGYWILERDGVFTLSQRFVHGGKQIIAPEVKHPGRVK